MPIRRYQIARKAIDKTKLDDDAQVKIETQLLLCRGAGIAITANAGTTYASLDSSDTLFNPAYYKNIVRTDFVVHWISGSTAGGVQLFNRYDGVAIYTREPGVAAEFIEAFDITDTIKGYTTEKRIGINTKGDGTTAPSIKYAYMRVVVSTAP